MKSRILLSLVLPILSAFGTALRAQLPERGGALVSGTLPPIALGMRLEDVRREVEDGGTSITLDMPRVVVTGQFPLVPGVSPWVEAGWHEPDLALGTGARGGFTWGAGLSVRPWLWAIRVDPETGPREWLALKTEAAVRSGSADAANGEVEWLQVEGRLGFEWRDVLLPAEEGPLGATGMTAGGGVVWTRLSAEKTGFDGSESSSMGAYAFTTFQFGPATFFGVEADLFGGGSRRLGLIAGRRF